MKLVFPGRHTLEGSVQGASPTWASLRLPMSMAEGPMPGRVRR